MKRFSRNQRVKIVTGEYDGMIGKTGTVDRMRMSDNGAWVKMDEDLPEQHRSFDEPNDSRFRCILLYPDECEAEKD